MTQATVLAIGTELVQGQITNRNAAWISERLTDLGIKVTAHLTVPDARPRIAAALTSLAAESDLLVVTGGLGPTSDDFTREVLAAWTGAPLEFVASAWEKIERRLSERGIEVAQSNRQQCFFPHGAVVLENGEGTADGFRFRHSGPGERSTEVLVLPGPPREGLHLWDRFVDAWLRATFPAESPADLERWQCLGKSESSLGEIVEAAVADFGVETGYRASMPYVEVKIWIPRDLAADRRRTLIARMDQALAPYSVARNQEDLSERFATALLARTGTAHVQVRDFGAGGRLAERVFGMLRSEFGKALRARVEVLGRLGVEPNATKAPTIEDWTLTLSATGEVTVAGPDGARSRALPNPYPNSALADRLAGYRAEMALKHFTELLEMAPR